MLQNLIRRRPRPEPAAAPEVPATPGAALAAAHARVADLQAEGKGLADQIARAEAQAEPHRQAVADLARLRADRANLLPSIFAGETTRDRLAELDAAIAVAEDKVRAVGADAEIAAAGVALIRQREAELIAAMREAQAVVPALKHAAIRERIEAEAVEAVRAFDLLVAAQIRLRALGLLAEPFVDLDAGRLHMNCGANPVSDWHVPLPDVPAVADRRGPFGTYARAITGSEVSAKSNTLRDELRAAGIL